MRIKPNAHTGQTCECVLCNIVWRLGLLMAANDFDTLGKGVIRLRDDYLKIIDEGTE